MKRTVLNGVIAALLGGTPAGPAGESQSPSQKSRNAPDQKKERLTSAGTWVGTVSDMAGDKASFTLSVPTYLVYRQAWRSPSGIHWSQRVHRNTLRETVWVPDDTKVRVLHEPEFDAKGRPVRSTPKPDPSDPDRRLGGKRGTADDLRPGQAVRVARVGSGGAPEWAALPVELGLMEHTNLRVLRHPDRCPLSGAVDRYRQGERRPVRGHVTNGAEPRARGGKLFLCLVRDALALLAGLLGLVGRHGGGAVQQRCDRAI